MDIQQVVDQFHNLPSGSIYGLVLMILGLILIVVAVVTW